VISSIGINGRVRGKKGNLISLCFYELIDYKYKPQKIISGKIGTKGLKEDTWYSLTNTGKFLEIED
jgi:hypothetical protein